MNTILMKRLRLTALVLLVTSQFIALAAWAQDQALPEWMGKYPIMRPISSRFDPAKALNLTQAQRWQLDFDLVNEADMRQINSRRFEVPTAYEQRARWFEEMAQGYLLADLINQLFEFRSSSTTHDEVAFTQLYELGKAGNEAAACMAEHFHRHFQTEITSHWAVTYDQVALAAAPYIYSQHPVCSELEWSLYYQGKGGFQKDLKRAEKAYVKPAVAGFYEWQRKLQISHPDGKDQMKPIFIEAFLCWARVADRQSAHSALESACYAYENGRKSDRNGQLLNVPEPISAIAHQWCEPSRVVTPQECAQLESQLDSPEI